MLSLAVQSPGISMNVWRAKETSKKVELFDSLCFFYIENARENEDGQKGVELIAHDCGIVMLCSESLQRSAQCLFIKLHRKTLQDEL